MDGALLFLIILVTISAILRSMIRASQNSAKEEAIRQVVRDHIQRKRLDMLYGRDKDED